jgi:Tol biopolymer transport system component
LRLTDTKRHDVTPWAPVRFSPEGRRVAFSAWGDPPESSRSPQLFVVDVETGKVERAVPEEREVMQVDPCWAPDGRSLVYAVPPGGERGGVRLRRVDLATQGVTPLPGAAGLFSPRGSRDGRLLAFDWPAQHAEKGARTHVRVLDPGGKAWRAVVVDAPNLNYPAWSRDGRHIYATSTPVDGPRTIVRFDVATGRAERLGRIDGLRSDLWLELTPDGAPMVHRDVSQREVVVMDWEVR